ncbi:MAG: hypothetical protein AAF149_16130 [Bacteroidota bacterium]
MNKYTFLTISTFKKLIPMAFAGVCIFLTACNNDDSDPLAGLTAEELRLREGYLVVGTLDGSTFVQYVEELPTGSIDVTQGTDFQEFNIVSVIGSTMYAQATDGSNGIEKLVVNELGEVVVVGEITTIEDAFGLSVRDSLFGVFHDTNDPSIMNTFNPATMEVTGTIDMSIVSELELEGTVVYSGSAFRGDNELILSVQVQGGSSGLGVPRAIVDLTAMRAIAITRYETTNLPNPAIVVTDNHFDEAGNYYGPYFSNQSFPAISGGILKIPAGQNGYDQTYNFPVPLRNNPELALGGPFFTGFEYIGNNKALAYFNASLDPRITEILEENEFNLANIDQNELNEILTLLNTSSTAIVAEIDVLTQSITPVEGVPAAPPFGGASLPMIDDQAHFILRSDEVNALYRHTGGSSAELIFEGTGARLISVIDLSQDFQ